MSRAQINLDREGVCARCGQCMGSASISACPACGEPLRGEPSLLEPIGLLSLPAMRYPDAYAWFIFVSFLDLLLTWLILVFAEGMEVNPIADAVITHAGSGGLVLFKFSLVMFVVVMCEWTGRRCPTSGRRLSQGAVAITSVPVLLSIIQIITA